MSSSVSSSSESSSSESSSSAPACSYYRRGRLVCELEQHIPVMELKAFFEMFKAKDKFVIVRRTPEDTARAKAISDHFQDPLHAILAKKAGADVLVTKNVQHFVVCKDLIKVVFPEDV